MDIPKRLHQIGFAEQLSLGLLCQSQATVLGWGGRDVTLTPLVLNDKTGIRLRLLTGWLTMRSPQMAGIVDYQLTRIPVCDGPKTNGAVIRF
jgi:hypothetical protein